MPFTNVHPSGIGFESPNAFNEQHLPTLKTINRHFPNASKNNLIFFENTGHTYRMKEQETADALLGLVTDWFQDK